tara:strand:+ start:2775 stop:3722 length:948 start_codon:yes stop_codon:yes gene_type:complete
MVKFKLLVMNKQNWKRVKHILKEDDFPRGYKGAAVPFIDKIKNNILKVYFSSRDKNNRSYIFWATFDITDNFSLLDMSTKPEFNLGNVGEFDENGSMGCQIFYKNNEKYLYYIGWNLGVSTPFRNSIGAVKWDNKLNQFKKIYRGPLLDRSIYDPCFVASHHIIKIGNEYLMYYLSCDEWIDIDGKLTHKYNIKIATSSNGVKWNPTGKIAIDFKSSYEYAISVPRVIFEDGIYKMWYSYRGSKEIPTYRIGYAESLDGVTWKRKDSLVHLDVISNSWESEMICYPYIFNHLGEKYMLYNGNGYGMTGIGIVKLI